MANHDEIFQRVSKVLEDALGVDPDEVTPGASLTRDLKAESIDFLDIVFRLEKEFQIKIDQGELFPDNVAQNPEYVQGGKVTDKGITELRARLPHADFSVLENDRDVDRVADVFTVNAIVRFVEGKLAAKAS